MTMADAMVTFGLKDAGYTYLAIDDCWLMKNRSADGHLVADPDRFPSGIKALADYMHERGLKLGMIAAMNIAVLIFFKQRSGLRRACFFF